MWLSDILKSRLGLNVLVSPSSPHPPTSSVSDCDLYTQHVAQWEPCLLNGIALMETYISRIISVFSCKWFGGGRGEGRFNTLPLSMNNSIIWIKWTPGAVGKALRRAVDPLPLPTSLFPSLSLSVPPSLQFHSPLHKMPHTCNFSLPSAKNLLSPERQRGGKKKKKNFKEEEGKRGKGGREFLINLLLDFGQSHLKARCNVSGKTSN